MQQLSSSRNNTLKNGLDKARYTSKLHKQMSCLFLKLISSTLPPFHQSTPIASHNQLIGKKTLEPGSDLGLQDMPVLPESAVPESTIAMLHPTSHSRVTANTEYLLLITGSPC